MLDIAEHRQKLILKNLAQLDDRTNEIQEECIILYLKSFIGDGELNCYLHISSLILRISSMIQ